MTEFVKSMISELSQQLRTAWSAATATTWTKDEPAQGQCSVTALVVQDLLGGSIVKTRVGACWHFYNLIDGERIDLTTSQFSEPIVYNDLASSREEAFGDTTEQQCQELRRALNIG